MTSRPMSIRHAGCRRPRSVRGGVFGSTPPRCLATPLWLQWAWSAWLALGRLGASRSHALAAGPSVRADWFRLLIISLGGGLVACLAGCARMAVRLLQVGHFEPIRHRCPRWWERGSIPYPQTHCPAHYRPLWGTPGSIGRLRSKQVAPARLAGGAAPGSNPSVLLEGLGQSSMKSVG